MNIFYLADNPTECAQYHADKHCVKMILEYSQLLSTAHRVLDGANAPDVLYKATHINHPCAKWVRESTANYEWLYNLLHQLHREYRYRYGREHASARLLNPLFNFPKNLPSGELTSRPQAMPDFYKSDNPIEAYRNYYIQEKAHLAKWKNRKVPYWYKV